MTDEQKEIIKHARAAYRNRQIDLRQLRDVYFMIARDIAEKELSHETS